MKLSYTMGMTACAALLVASGLAQAADLAAAGTYSTSGYITSATDAAGGAYCAAFGLSVGTPSTSVIFYPGAGKTGFSLVSPGTSPAARTIAGTVSGNTLTVTAGGVEVGNVVTFAVGSSNVTATVTAATSSTKATLSGPKQTVSKAESMSVTGGGATTTSLCTSTAAVPATGLNGDSANFSCYSNTQLQATLPTTPVATIAATFTAGASSSTPATNTINVDTASVLTVGSLACTFTTDATWTAK